MEYKDGEYFLTDEETKSLLEQSIRPDESIMRRRDVFLAEIDESINIEYQENGAMIVTTNEPVEEV